MARYLGSQVHNKRGREDISRCHRPLQGFEHKQVPPAPLTTHDKNASGIQPSNRMGYKLGRC